MNPVETLKAVLCGQDGKCCIAGSQADRDTVDTALAAIQHYLDQHKAELPVLPGPYFGSGRYLGVAGSRDAYTTTQIQTYGAACAAQARELALSESIEAAIDVCGFNGVSAQTESHIRQAIEALKGK